MTRPDPKWVQFEESLGKPGRKTRVFLVFLVSTKSGAIPEQGGGLTLGRISWWGPWRRYAFFPEPATLFETQCLRDVAAFLDWLMAERKAART